MEKHYLPNTTSLGLTFDNLIEDIKNIIRDNPNYSANWNDFLSSNAGKMLLEMVAYMIEQLGIRIDLITNELFISTVQQEEAKRAFLKLLNYTPSLPECAQVKVKAVADRVYTRDILMPYPFVVNATDNNGGSARFELIKKTSDGKYEYPITNSYTGHLTYFSINNYNPKVNQMFFYEGTTLSQSYTATGTNDELIVLDLNNVINKSLRMWKVIRDINGNITTYGECGFVDNLISPEAQRKSALCPFKFELQLNGQIGLRFGSRSIMVTQTEYEQISGDSTSGFMKKLPESGDEFVVYYRAGGGINNNIRIGSFSDSRGFFDTENGAVVTMSFNNEEEGRFGSDTETIDESLIKAPIQISTNKRLVTAKDYNDIINTLPSVVKSISYGQSNKPFNVYELYGYDIRPLEVWNYIIPKISSLQNKKTWEYQDLFRMKTTVQDVINERYAFSTGEKNIPITMSNSALIISDEYCPGTVSVAGAIVNTNTITGANTNFTVAFAVGEFITLQVIPGTIASYVTRKIATIVSDTELTVVTNEAAPNDANFTVDYSSLKYTSSLQDLPDYSSYRSYTILNKDIAKKFIASAALLKIGTNDCYTFNTEANSSTAEKLNLKITNSPLVDSLIKWPNAGSDYTFTGTTLAETYATKLLLKADDGKFTFEIYNETFIKITVQNSSSVDTSLNLHYLKPECFYRDGYQYFYLTANNLFPDNYDGTIYFKILQDKTPLRTVESITGEKSLYSDYNMSYNSLLEKYIIDTSGTLIVDSTISDFIPMYINYIIDNRGINIDCASETDLAVNVNNFINSSKFKFRINFEVGKKAFSEEFSNKTFYDVLNPMFIGADAIPLTTITATTNSVIKIDTAFFNNTMAYTTIIRIIDPLASDNGNWRTIVDSSDGYTATVSPPFSNVTPNYYVGKKFEVITKPSTGSVITTLNNIFSLAGTAYIKNNLRATYDSQKKTVIFKIRELNASVKEQIKVQFITPTTLSSDEADLQEQQYLGKISTALSDANLDGISDMYETTDEYYFNILLDDKKIIAIDNIYKQPIFKTFDYVCTITYRKNFNPNDVKANVRTILRNKFNLFQTEFNASVLKNQIESLIYQVNGVMYSTTNYFGRDYNNQTVELNTDILTSDFDEILIMSDDKYLTGYPELQDYQTNGLLINMVKEG